MLPCETIYLLVKYAKCSLKIEANRPRRQIWVDVLGVLPTYIKKRVDTERTVDSNEQKADKCAVRLGRRVGVALKAQGSEGHQGYGPFFRKRPDLLSTSVFC